MLELGLLFLVFLITGLVTGALSSLFGIGGGLIVVPVMFVVLHVVDHVPTEVVMHVAVATSLAVMLVTTLNSFYNHYSAGNLVWSLVKIMVPCMAVGTLLGLYLSHFLHSDILKYLFIALLFIILLLALFKKDFTQRYEMKDFVHPPALLTGASVFGTGVLSVLLGIGGSIIIVPYFRKFKLPIQNASALAVSISPVVALIGSIGYIITGLHYHGQLPPHCFGFINLPALIGIAVGTFAGVPIGMRIGKKVSDKILAKAYLVLLVIIIGSMFA